MTLGGESQPSLRASPPALPTAGRFPYEKSVKRCRLTICRVYGTVHKYTAPSTVFRYYVCAGHLISIRTAPSQRRTLAVNKIWPSFGTKSDQTAGSGTVYSRARCLTFNRVLAGRHRCYLRRHRYYLRRHRRPMFCPAIWLAVPATCRSIASITIYKQRRRARSRRHRPFASWF